MTRLQKKCLIATAGTHLLAIVLLFCSGFITSKPKPDQTQLLDVIPENVIEAAMNSGVRNPTPPPPLPPVTKPPEPQPEKQPQPDPPKPQPEKQPDPEPVTPEKLPDPDVTPVVKPKPPKHEMKIDLSVKVKNPTKVVPQTPEKDTSEADAKREQERQRKALAARLNRLTQSLKDNLSSSAKVTMPEGDGSVSFASYASVVKSIYEAKWQPPDDAANDEAVTKVSVTIARDGRVIESHIVNPSGDARVDASVRRTLDRVDFIKEFPDGAKEAQKIFIINFNLKSKRMNG
jgi:TonB family protein